MDPAFLRKLLGSETERVEWKESTADVDGLYKAVCALANDLGGSGQSGHLVLGVNKRGEIVGLRTGTSTLDEEQKKLADRLRQTRLQPTPAFDIEVVQADDSQLLVVRVDPYPVPPIVTVDGVAWVRSGSTTVRAREADQLRLRDRRPEKSQPFDIRPMRGASLEDLDTARLVTMHAAARGSDEDPDTYPTFEAWLTQQQLGRSVDGRWTPNAAALLLFGTSTQAFIPGAAVEFVRYKGIDVDSPVLSRRPAMGTLTDQLDALWAQLANNIVELPEPALGPRTPYVNDYSVDVLKELARNLVQHRLYEGTNAPGRIEWFDDRIEFSNPGGPFGRASEGEFGTHSDYRNPVTTRWLSELGYVEHLGRGVRRVRRLLENSGSPPLGVETDGFTRVTVRRHP